MPHAHNHDHDDHGHHHHHHHDDDDAPPVGRPRLRLAVRLALACVLLAGAVLAASATMVGAGEAVAIARFGDIRRVETAPGLRWKLPVPIETAIPVDLRLRTTSTGLQDVGTRDGLRVLVQAYAAWSVPAEPEAVRRFLRAVRNDPDEAARQLRGFVGSALQVTASDFAFADLVNTDPAKLRLAAFEARLQAQVARQMRETYGIAVAQIGVERLTLPEATLAATVARMRTERETVAAERTAEGLRQASEIRAGAVRDQRITVANARTAAADIDAQARKEAADIHARAYAADPQLYMLLRSLDTLGEVVGSNTRLLLRTDAAPFNLLTEGPPGAGAPTAQPLPPGLAQAGPRR